jgi:hypothetical protein
MVPYDVKAVHTSFHSLTQQFPTVKLLKKNATSLISFGDVLNMTNLMNVSERL